MSATAQATRGDGAVAHDGPVAAEPYIKWVGSKRWLVRKHSHLLPDPRTVRTLGVPFVGGGAIVYHYAAAGVPSWCSDTNDHLITTYFVVRDHVEPLIDALSEIETAGYGRAQYEAIRERFNRDRAALPVHRAAWFITISRWGFNGLWRVNGKGLCNVPFGKPSKAGAVPRLCDADVLRACSRALRVARFEVCDFEEHVARMRPTTEDALFFDPPYVPASATANFTGYTADGFGPADQRRLVALLDRLDAAGVRWALSNSDTPESRALYTRSGWNITSLSRSGAVSCKTDGRSAVGEILVRNFT